MQVTLYDLTNKEKEKIEISDHIFNTRINNYIIWLAVKVEEANKRVGTAHTKTKADVAGSGKKPWKQKGTGRARVGTRRNPVWKGGGVAFGPKLRDYTLKINKQVKRLAFISLFSLKNKKNSMRFIEDISLSNGKTKELAGILDVLGVNSSTVLIFGDKKFIDTTEKTQALSISDNDKKIKTAANNIPYFKAYHWNQLAVKDLFYSNNVLITESALRYIEEKYLQYVSKKALVNN